MHRQWNIFLRGELLGIVESFRDVTQAKAARAAAIRSEQLAALGENPEPLGVYARVAGGEDPPVGLEVERPAAPVRHDAARGAHHGAPPPRLRALSACEKAAGGRGRRSCREPEPPRDAAAATAHADASAPPRATRPGAS